MGQGTRQTKRITRSQPLGRRVAVPATVIPAPIPAPRCLGAPAATGSACGWSCWP